LLLTNATYTARYEWVGPNKQTTMRTVASMIQECACNHVQSMWGRARSTPRAMREANLAFVCTRLHIEMREYPKWGDQVEVKTWLDVPGRATARRDWEMVLCDGPEGECKALGVATSRWVAFNVEKRKMARIPAAVVEQVTKQALPGCHAMGPGYAAGKLRDIRAAPGLSKPVKHSVRRSDMDMNGHVNNVVFTEWLLEAVPQKMFSDFDLTELEIEFLSECNYGEEVDAVCCREVVGEGLVVEEDEVRVAHMLLKHGAVGKEAEMVRARSVWKRKGFLRAEEREMAEVIKHAYRRRDNVASLSR
jgi:fatty acyl-ACP thioesterase A